MISIVTLLHGGHKVIAEVLQCDGLRRMCQERDFCIRVTDRYSGLIR
jgi:hypothetical protein